MYTVQYHEVAASSNWGTSVENLPYTVTDRTSWISSPLHRTIARDDINSNPLRKTQACTCQPLGSGPLIQSRLFHFLHVFNTAEIPHPTVVKSKLHS